jgi:tRNA(Arg) A34 adenosine deaminase TadA
MNTPTAQKIDVMGQSKRDPYNFGLHCPLTASNTSGMGDTWANDPCWSFRRTRGDGSLRAAEVPVAIPSVASQNVRMTHDRDDHFLRAALEAAWESSRNGDEPFGAAIAIGGEFIVASQNYSKRSGRPWMHAEAVAIESALEARGTEALRTATLYSSTEPCPMCCGYVHWADIPRLVYSCSAGAFRRFRPHKAFLPCRAVFEGMGTAIEIAGPRLEREGLAPHERHWT